MDLREAALKEPPAGPPVIVVGSGKGGVGKSILSVLLAGELTRRGQRALLLDGSQNLGNLHVMLGVHPRARLEGVLTGEIEPGALVHPVTDRLSLIPGDSGTETLYALGAVDRARLHHRLCGLYDDFDAVVVDAGPGIESVVRLSTMRGTRLLVVTLPEAPALTDAYALIKIVHLQLPSLPMDVVINRARDASEGEQAYERLATACRRFLSREVELAGVIAEEPAMRDLLRAPARLLAAEGIESARAVVTGVVSRELAARTVPAAVPVQ
jgi:flagellar biosynthesis protein FlhG